MNEKYNNHSTITQNGHISIKVSEDHKENFIQPVDDADWDYY